MNQRYAIIPGATPNGDGTYSVETQLSQLELYQVTAARQLKAVIEAAIREKYDPIIEELEREVAALKVANRNLLRPVNPREVDSTTLSEWVKDGVKAYMRKIGLDYSKAPVRGKIYTAIYRDFNASIGLVSTPAKRDDENIVDAYIRLGFGEQLKAFIEGYEIIRKSTAAAPRRKKRTKKRQKTSVK